MDGVRAGRQDSQSLGQSGSGGSFEDTVLSAAGLHGSVSPRELGAWGTFQCGLLEKRLCYQKASSIPAITMDHSYFFSFLCPNSFPTREGAIGKTMHPGGREKREQKGQNINPFFNC